MTAKSNPRTIHTAIHCAPHAPQVNKSVRRIVSNVTVYAKPPHIYETVNISVILAYAFAIIWTHSVFRRVRMQSDFHTKLFFVSLKKIQKKNDCTTTTTINKSEACIPCVQSADTAKSIAASNQTKFIRNSFKIFYKQHQFISVAGLSAVIFDSDFVILCTRDCTTVLFCLVSLIELA